MTPSRRARTRAAEWSWCPPLQATELSGDGDPLYRVLERAQKLGLIGRNEELADHIAHARGYGTLPRPPRGQVAVDLGSGNGLPSLVLASEWPGTEWWLVEASSTRCDFLRWAVAALGLGSAVEVLEGTAEHLAHDAHYRERAELVVARAFGPPGPTAECAVGFLRPGGRLAVSEPPEASADRWPEAGLSVLGLSVGPTIESPVRLQLLVRSGELPEEYPRREGVPRRQPLF